MLRFLVLCCLWFFCGLLGVSTLGSVPVFLCSNVVCLYLGVYVGRFRWGMTLGGGTAMLMRGGACATEMCLMVGWVCVIVSS